MTITISSFLACCGGFSAICLAGGYLIKIIKAVKKPAEDLNDKLAYYDEKLRKEDKAIARLNEIAKNNTDCLQLLLESTLTMLSHMEDNNHFGEIKAQKNKIQSYLMDKAM